jgi:hypothetical protein
VNTLSPDSLEQALSTLAGVLEADGAAHETLVVVGGGALIALGIVSRTTKDVDIMAGVAGESFPEIVKAALKDLGYGHLVARL